MFMPFFYIINFPYIVPLLAGMIAGAAGMIPAAFGCVFYYFMKYTVDYVALSKTTASEDMIEGISIYSSTLYRIRHCFSQL